MIYPWWYDLTVASYQAGHALSRSKHTGSAKSCRSARRHGGRWGDWRKRLVLCLSYPLPARGRTVEAANGPRRFLHVFERQVDGYLYCSVLRKKGSIICFIKCFA